MRRYPIRAIETELSGTLGLVVRMEKIECDYDLAAKLVFAG